MLGVSLTMNRFLVLLLLFVSLDLGATRVVPNEENLGVKGAAKYSINMEYDKDSYSCGEMVGVSVTTPVNLKSLKLLKAYISNKSDEISPLFIERSNSGNKILFCMWERNRDTLELQYGNLKNPLTLRVLRIRMYEKN